MARVLGWGVLGLVVLLVLGVLAVKLVGVLFKIAAYLLILLVLVGGASYLFAKARKALTGGRRRDVR